MRKIAPISLLHPQLNQYQHKVTAYDRYTKNILKMKPKVLHIRPTHATIVENKKKRLKSVCALQNSNSCRPCHHSYVEVYTSIQKLKGLINTATHQAHAKYSDCSVVLRCCSLYSEKTFTLILTLIITLSLIP